jgi:hypothetical protein
MLSRQRGYESAVSQRSLSFDDITASLKKSAAALNRAEVPFLLGGSLACWARGGPESTNDLDLMVRPADAERALAVLTAEGMRPERPPEGWLLKAWDGDVLIDLIFSPLGMEIDEQVLERSDRMNVCSMPVSVMTLEDVLSTKLMSLNEHYLDYSSLLQIARGVREQVDWAEVRERTAESPYARPFFVLLQELEVLEEPVGPKVS